MLVFLILVMFSTNVYLYDQNVQMKHEKTEKETCGGQMCKNPLTIKK